MPKYGATCVEQQVAYNRRLSNAVADSGALDIIHSVYRDLGAGYSPLHPPFNGSRVSDDGADFLPSSLAALPAHSNTSNTSRVGGASANFAAFLDGSQQFVSPRGDSAWPAPGSAVPACSASAAPEPPQQFDGAADFVWQVPAMGGAAVGTAARANGMLFRPSDMQGAACLQPGSDFSIAAAPAMGLPPDLHSAQLHTQHQKPFAAASPDMPMAQQAPERPQRRRTRSKTTAAAATAATPSFPASMQPGYGYYPQPTGSEAAAGFTAGLFPAEGLACSTVAEAAAPTKPTRKRRASTAPGSLFSAEAPVQNSGGSAGSGGTADGSNGGDGGAKARSSQYRGVTRHRRSGRWEAHLWVKALGRQVGGISLGGILLRLCVLFTVTCYLLQLFSARLTTNSTLLHLFQVHLGVCVRDVQAAEAHHLTYCIAPSITPVSANSNNASSPDASPLQLRCILGVSWRLR